MQSKKTKRAIAGGVLATALTTAAVVATPAFAWSDAPCSYNGSKISCQYGARMTGQGKGGGYATADATYAGPVTYMVSCRISTGYCQWQRVN